MFFLFPDFSYAGAWTRESGRGLFVQNFSYYSTNKYFYNSGKKQQINSYRKYELNPYLEYGVRNWLTVGVNLFAERASQNRETNWGIGDSEFFARARLWKQSNFVFSAEPMIKLPSLSEKTDTPKIGNNNLDTGLTLSAGYSFKYLELDHFINIDGGYRHRLGKPNDQLKFSATAGMSVTKKSKILAQIFQTEQVNNKNNVTFTQSSSDDYDLTKLQISGIYEIYDRISLQLGVFTNAAGRNTGSGDGGLIAISKEF